MAPKENETTEEHVKKCLARSNADSLFRRWVSVGKGELGIRMNWVTSLLAVIITWGFAIICLVDQDNAPSYTRSGQSWIVANFTWLYILTQDLWCIFLIYVCFSRFGTIKLGKDDEKPRFNDFTWFSMLFTCGVAVGLYVYGVAEPLYFYRNPTSQHAGGWDYAHTKSSTETDAQRAQQAIFMAVYHWGIHGWVPYILTAILIGTVSFRWGLPMTIRSCFYPLLGDHALGLFGDVIDALSVSTTTFGVCTSLGLGVAQLSRGLKFVKNIGCDEKANCEAAGGTWNRNTYGSQNCFGAESTYDDCSASWLSSPSATTESYYWIIIIITLLASASVVSGLNYGIKFLAKCAFLCGTIVMMSVLYGDNTWYLLNVMVQTTGYYMQHILQVGFDCEAFQQLNQEWTDGGNNRFWGSSGSLGIGARMNAAGLTPVLSSNDCGNQVNPCSKGMIWGSQASALTAAAATATPIAAAAATTFLKSMKMSPHSITTTGEVYKKMVDVYSSAPPGVLCGSGWNTTHADAFTKELLGFTSGAKLCAGLTGDDLTNCNSLWSGNFPRCPEETVDKTKQWGVCATYRMSCPTVGAFFDDTHPKFMDWWTIFYWAWWITWAPFVGFFVALISRGRTIRQVIVGGFFVPTAFCTIWFSIFGGLAIKMERTAEIALQVRPDTMHAAVTCAEHYSGGVPITPEAKKLADAGYYMLTCMNVNDQIYHVMEPYTNMTGFLHFFLWVGLVIYFLTSSDSGSMTDDIISASGLNARKIPSWQKVFWCWTEGLVAIALVNNPSQLSALRAISIIIGLPFTIFLCMMVPATYRALKHVMGDEDIKKKAKKFNTQLLDFCELFTPKGGSPHGRMTHLKELAIGLALPGKQVYDSLKKVFPESPSTAIIYGALAEAFLVAFVVFQLIEIGTPMMHVLGWLCHFGLVCIVTYTRGSVREHYNVWGSYMDDIWVALVAWPFATAQCSMMVTVDGAGAPQYFQDVDECIAEMKAIDDGADIEVKVKQLEASA